jgi:hypothetical protein
LAAPKVPLVFKVFREQQDLKVLQALLGQMELRVPREYKAVRARKVYKVPPASKDLDTPSCRVPLELRELKAYRVCKGFKVS